jgi:hypothetical protein
MTKTTSVTLTRQQVADIIIDMGWEPGDASAFWTLARRKHADPGYLARVRDAYVQGILRNVASARTEA